MFKYKITWVSSCRMLTTWPGLPDHSLLSILSAADSTPAVAACCACCLSAGAGGGVLGVRAACCAWLQCLQLGPPQLLLQTELLSASFYWLLAELFWML